MYDQCVTCDRLMTCEQVDVPDWFIAVIDVQQRTLVQGTQHSPEKYRPPTASSAPTNCHTLPQQTATLYLSKL